MNITKGSFRLAGRKAPVLSTLKNAVSVVASANEDIDLAITNETEIFILFQVNKQPWTASATVAAQIATYRTEAIFPIRSAVATISQHGADFYPSIVLSVAATDGGITPSSVADARSSGFTRPYAGQIARFTNSHATDTCTLTVKVLRRFD